MRLSEHDRRVLAEFENCFRDSDPGLVLQFQRWTAELEQSGGTVPSPVDAPRYPQLVALAPTESRVTDGS